MSTGLNDCKDCLEESSHIPIKESNLATLHQNKKTFCRLCKNKVACSICEKTIQELNADSDSSTDSSDEYDITMEVSDFNEKPICSLCKEEQCYKCGAAEAEHTTWHGKPICEDCGMDWCNKCGDYEGGCDERCPSCDAPCDAECGCEIECEICGEEFTYEPYYPWLRKMDGLKPKKSLDTFQDYKCVCTDCWGDEEE